MSKNRAPDIWENYITLHSSVAPDFTLLDRASAHLETDARRDSWNALNYSSALKADDGPLPEIDDREGYYGPDHFSYWASGLADATLLMDAAAKHGLKPKSFLDLGCASGRVIRHFPYAFPGVETYGCDINRLHVEWCNSYLHPDLAVFQNTSIPSLPMEDNSLDMVSAYSVFTHIEAMETAWLMEIRRVLRPGGIAWITVHTEGTLAAMTEDWPIWSPVMNHNDTPKSVHDDRTFDGDRLVLRWDNSRSYASNVFYKTEYLRKHWGRFFEILEIRPFCPNFQDVLILRA